LLELRDDLGHQRRDSLHDRLHGVDALLDFSELKHIYQNVGTLG